MSSNLYTPSTEEVRTDYIMAYTERQSSQLLAGLAFDRWHQAELRRAKAEALRDAAEVLTLPYNCELMPDGREDFRAGVAVEVNGEFVQELRHRADQIEEVTND